MALVLVAVVGAVGPAVAQPTIAVGDVSLERPTTAVGEPVNATVKLRNSGEDGAIILDVEATGRYFTSEHFQVPSDSTKEVSVPFSVSSTGSFDIRVEGQDAGTLTVVQARATDVTERTDGRNVTLRGSSEVEDGEVAIDVPAAENRSDAVRQVTLRSDGTEFNATTRSYAPPDDAPFETPVGDGTTVLGAVATDSDDNVAVSQVRVGVDRQSLSDAGLDRSDVNIYERTEDGFAPLETRQVSTSDGTITYAATVTDGSELVVGVVEPSFVIEDWNLDYEDAGDGTLVVLDATVANEGVTDGVYTGELRIDGRVVAEATTTIPGGNTSDVHLEYVLTESGAREVMLDDLSVGTVVVSDGDGSTSANATENPVPDQSSGGGIGPTGDLLSALSGLFESGPGLADVGIGAGVALVGGLLVVALRG